VWPIVTWLVQHDRWGVAWLLAVLVVAVSAVASAHILLNKRQSTAAVAWTGLVWLSPLVGPMAYLVFGINRIQRKAVRLLGPGGSSPVRSPRAPSELPTSLHPYAALARAVGRITGGGLVYGNRVELLRNGDEAYPVMLEAIRAARRSVSLLTYILDDDRWGRRFVDALSDAHRRGVAVRVLVDGIGARRGRGALRALRAAGVPTQVFLWSWAPWKMALINLRNHRKLLVADGRVGFTGGMNIRQAYVHEEPPVRPRRGPSGSSGLSVAGRIGGPGEANDLHFRLKGPVLSQLQDQFAIDWAFASGEQLRGSAWYPRLRPAGPSVARVIPEGPDEDLNKLSAVLFQALGAAMHSVLIVTPYFVPPPDLYSALAAAALRGVRVDVVLPDNNEPAFMNRVVIDKAEPLLRAGVRIGFKPGPFEHTKLFVVDDAWVLLGSSNWDPRSLRLNFELNVEVYDPGFARDCRVRMAREHGSVRWLSPEDVRARSLGRRVLDAGIRMFEAYL
jgi:cardiolipin synthase A/B